MDDNKKKIINEILRIPKILMENEVDKITYMQVNDVLIGLMELVAGKEGQEYAIDVITKELIEIGALDEDGNIIDEV